LSVRGTGFEIFNFNDAMTFKTGLGIGQGKMSPFDREPMTSYRHSTFYSNHGSILCRFWDIQCQKISWTCNPGHGSVNVIECGTIR